MSLDLNCPLPKRGILLPAIVVSVDDLCSPLWSHDERGAIRFKGWGGDGKRFEVSPEIIASGDVWAALATLPEPIRFLGLSKQTRNFVFQREGV